MSDQLQSGPFRARLGQAVRDTLTGKGGFVTMRAERLYGGPLCFLEPGDKWFLEERLEDDSPAQAEHQADPWEASILQHIQGEDFVDVGHVLNAVLNISIDRQTQADYSRVSMILQSHGWRLQRKRQNEERVVKGYRPPINKAKVAAK